MISKVVSLLDAFGPTTPELSLGDLARVHRAARSRPRTGSPRNSWSGAGWSGPTAPGTASGCGCGNSGRWRRAAERSARSRCPSCRTSTRRRTRTCTWPCATASRRCTWTRSPVTGRCPRGRAAGGGCRCTRPASARCSWRTPRRRCCPRSWTAACAATPPTPWSLPGHLRRALADVRRNGVAYAREEMTLGSLSVAAPVVGHGAARWSPPSAVVLDPGARRPPPAGARRAHRGDLDVEGPPGTATRSRPRRCGHSSPRSHWARAIARPRAPAAVSCPRNDKEVAWQAVQSRAADPWRAAWQRSSWRSAAAERTR